MDKRKKNIRTFPKIVIHIIAISFFMLGIIILHTVANSRSENFTIFFFGVEILKSVIFDIGILCICTGFFIEFFFTFKPIYILTKKRK